MKTAGNLTRSPQSDRATGTHSHVGRQSAAVEAPSYGLRFVDAGDHADLPIQRKKNNTGLPDHLKFGIESLSDISLDNVRVHYNSSRPAQLNALAYAQGSNIHVAPGQEQHLPHEVWHLVQQAQARVRPTLRLREGIMANDDERLEREAEMMGSKALAAGTSLLQGKWASVPGLAADVETSVNAVQEETAASSPVQRLVVKSATGWAHENPGRQFIDYYEADGVSDSGQWFDDLCRAVVIAPSDTSQRLFELEDEVCQLAKEGKSAEAYKTLDVMMGIINDVLTQPNLQNTVAEVSRPNVGGSRPQSQSSRAQGRPQQTRVSNQRGPRQPGSPDRQPSTRTRVPEGEPPEIIKNAYNNYVAIPTHQPDRKYGMLLSVKAVCDYYFEVNPEQNNQGVIAFRKKLAVDLKNGRPDFVNDALAETIEILPDSSTKSLKKIPAEMNCALCTCAAVIRHAANISITTGDLVRNLATKRNELRSQKAPLDDWVKIQQHPQIFDSNYYINAGLIEAEKVNLKAKEGMAKVVKEYGVNIVAELGRLPLLEAIAQMKAILEKDNSVVFAVLLPGHWNFAHAGSTGEVEFIDYQSDHAEYSGPLAGQNPLLGIRSQKNFFEGLLGAPSLIVVAYKGI